MLLGACSGRSAEPSAATPPPDATSDTPEPAEHDRGSRGCDVPARARPPEEVPHYDMSLRVDADAGVVTGRSDVTFVADRATRRLVFRLWPNGPLLEAQGAQLVVEEAAVRGGAATVEQPDPTTVVFELGERLPPGESVVAEMRWTLELPGPVHDRISQNGDSIRLGSFFPILAWEGERGWATDPPTTSLAEASTSPTADFDVTIEIPSHLDAIATGRKTSDGGGDSEYATSEWEARDVRDFALAVGFFGSSTGITADAGRQVVVTVGVAKGVDVDSQDFAEAIGRALEDLAERYGPYPWPTLSMAVLPDLGRSGIEYPSMIFQGEDSLRWATTHEVAHSWFYGLVGNNQARDPWLDEGVTSWAQARGDDILGYFRDYDISDVARNQLGRGMPFWDEHGDDYYDGVYAQGVKALDALGRAKRVDCALRRYVAQNAYGVATTEDLVDALEPSFPRAERVLKRFGARL